MRSLLSALYSLTSADFMAFTMPLMVAEGTIFFALTLLMASVKSFLFFLDTSLVLAFRILFP